MGSISGNENTRPDAKEIRVLVTGFGPFRAQFPINPSWEIASRLPSYVPTDVKDEGHHPHARPPINKHTPRIKIETYGAPVHVGYKAVRELVPVLLDDTKPDYILHIGMASGRSFYSCERRGHRDGYFMKDVDGSVLNDEYNKIKEGDDWVWHDCPGELLTSLPFDKMFRQWKEACPEVDTRISEDAGNYLCDFIYYTSLAHRYKHQKPNKAMFLHVPVDSDPESVRKGVEITTELIRAMVECDLKAQANTGDDINTTEEKVDL
ncbi:uncharacterized protein EAE98_000134 [Botrytis deweyae]|uniref:Peptidase C15, pyroglutamyl peptidase I-like protein n=1 Tax=Botrytis deweyae TaxID=2478750 RepID=A0ABQ7J1U0_9HELO|nr:uncharacterized protein EAE98_000134 [Botrytis deweyae]KAF7940007.1 hypothetical protein EAE98_000134 [Botrytis deweyae]